MMIRPTLALLLLSLAATASAAPPSTVPGVTDKLPHVQVDVKNKAVRVECESCNAHQDVGLEFFCVISGGNEYEAVLRTEAKPSNVHLALLMIGMEPGEPLKYLEAAKKWMPPHGPPLQITCEWTDKDGKPQRVPAYRLMRNNKTKKEAQPFTWVFTGSKLLDDGKYGADMTGYVVSVLNNELAMIDVPSIVGTALESRELDRNDDLLPEAGKKIWMVIEPAGRKDTAPPATQKADAEDLGETIIGIDKDGKVKIDGMPVPADRVAEVLANRRVPTPVQVRAAAGAPGDVVASIHKQVDPTAPFEGISDVHTDEQLMARLRDRWQKAVAPHDKALREAAQAHYEVIEAMRREQQRLIDEADRIQQTIDDLQKEYQEMTTPRPQAGGTK